MSVLQAALGDTEQKQFFTGMSAARFETAAELGRGVLQGQVKIPVS